jgi:thioredoxin 1
MDIKDSTFEQETKEGISVIDFWAEWCGPCRAIAPAIEELSKSYENTGVKILKANVDECSELSTKFGIRSIPTIVVLKDGVEVARHNGSGPIKDKVEEMVNKAKTL